MIDYTVDFRGLREQVEKFRQFAAIADRRLKESMERAVRQLAGNVRGLAPGSVAGAIGEEVRHIAPLAIDGVVSAKTSPPVVGIVLEFGRKPGGRMPPPDVFGGGAEAFAIARSIARRGTRGFRYMWHGFGKSRSAILREFQLALERIAEDLEVHPDGP